MASKGSSNRHKKTQISLKNQDLGKEMVVVEYDEQQSQRFPSGAVKGLLTFAILFLACLAAFSARLFAVIRFESIIHEFDPW